MKKKIILGLSLSILTLAGYAQNKIDLSDLEMPSSPAFILLDVAPTSIDRPTTTKAFSTSILNSINQNNGTPENYALEFAPYWFFKHEKLDALGYWGIKKTLDGTKQRPFSQVRYGNISFATVKPSNTTDSAGSMQELTNMSFGIRTTLIQYRSTKDVKDLVALHQAHAARLSQINNDPNLTPDEVLEKLKNDTFLSENAEKIKAVLNRKPVFALDFAGAAAWSFTNNNYNSIDVNRAGAWLTANYSGALKKNSADNYLNIYAVSRLMRDNNTLNEAGQLSSSNVFDAGGKNRIPN